ncbi:hypothetical protein KY290_021778 [Solanum tuberosum]|uniref:Uncharacterized protein n=1 Tax=Solanum tuberosum TaxID=4113 RepID=A0ABQ7V2I3_SOLTU|nr:hypothetical protein KY289_020942 [Solanum tuberosum]KAH0758285.1 hypothetical protein KY290_021778 [Solanum tuberosum]
MLISGNIGKCFVVSSRSLGRTPLITPSKSYVIDVVSFSNCRMLLEEFSFLLSFSMIRGPSVANVGKHFVLASRSPGRTPLITPSKSCAGVDKVACD